MSEEKRKSIKIEEIDFDKLELSSTSSPHNLPYAHSRGSSPISTISSRHIATRGIKAMGEQVDIQMQQIMEQMKFLANQVESLKEKKKLSQIIYGAQMNFTPVIGEVYHLYEQEDEYILSILSPQEWGDHHLRGKKYICQVRLAGDYSWEIEKQENTIDWLEGE